MRDVYLQPNPVAPAEVIRIDPEKCTGCNACAGICRTQTILPHPEQGKAPVVVYPDECWLCGCCVEACRQGALSLRIPINQKLFFKRKSTGERYRIASGNTPAQSWFDPPIG